MFDLKTLARIEPSFSTVAVVRPNMNINILVIVCIVLGPRPSQLLRYTYTLNKSMYYNKKRKNSIKRFAVRLFIKIQLKLMDVLFVKSFVHMMCFFET